MAFKMTESIGSVVMPVRSGSGLFLTPLDDYRLVIRRKYITEDDCTAQLAYSARATEVTLEEEMAAWDSASDAALEGFENSL
jgi:hypothetical protein